jgi:hypothetical protein
MRCVTTFCAVFIVLTLQTTAAACLPLDFVENCGQWPSETRFVAGRGEMTAILELRGIAVRRGAYRLRLNFEGAAETELIGEAARATQYNFFLGADPARWQSQVVAYTSVLYRGLYHRIDLRVREQDGRLEYDLLLAPNADLDRVRIRCDDIQSLRITPDGALEMQTPAGILRQSPPKTWETLPDGRTRPVDCRFQILDAQHYGFTAPARNPDLPLTIDPGLEWSTYIGGFGSEQVTAAAVALDGTGDVFVAGFMNSPDFPFFTDPNFTWNQNRLFVARLSADGSTLHWATLMGGWYSLITYHGLAAAPDGGVVVAGENFSPDFPTTPGAYDRIANTSDAFVVRLDASGAVVFSTFLGGSNGEKGYAVGFDPAGNIIVGGETSSPDFPTTPGAFDRTYANPSDATQGDAHGDIFITRLTPDGSAITYSTFIGGRSADVLEDMEVDSLGNVNIAGWITGHNIEVFPTTADAFDRTWSGSQDSIFARLRPDGAGSADLKYSTLMGGSNADNFYAIALDPLNPDIITLAGMTWSDNFPVTPGVVKTTNPRASELFESQAAVVARFHVGTRRLLWSTYVGPVGPAANIRATDVTVNSAGEPIVIGLMGDRYFPTTRGAFDRLPEGFLNGGGDFIARLSANASQYLYSTYFGSGDVDSFFLSPRIAYVGGNTVVVAGATGAANFPVTAGAYDKSYNHLDDLGTDAFVFRFTTEPDASGDLTVGTPTPFSPPNGATFPQGSYVGRLQWTEVLDASGIDGYEFQMSSRPDFINAIPGTTHIPEIIYPAPGSGDAGLALGTTYWRVRAYDRAGNVGTWSATSSFRLDVPNSPPAIQFFDTYPRKIVGGQSAVGVLHLDNPAPAGGLTATLHLRYNTSVGFVAPNRPIPVSVPTSVTVPAGAISVLFDITSTPLTSSLAVDVVAILNGIGKSVVLTVETGPETEVASLVVNPNTVTGGNTSTGTITLRQPAPPGGLVVDLATSHPQAARVPASITVPAGEIRATFPITTLPMQFDIDSYVDASTSRSLTRQYIFVKPPGWPKLNSFTLDRTEATGGTIVTGRVDFSGTVPFSVWPAFLDARVMTYSSDPAVAGMSPFVAVWSGNTSESFFFLVHSVPTNTTLQLFAAYDDVVLSQPLLVRAGPPVTLASVTLNVSTVRGTHGGVATVNLSAPAPAGGVSVLFTATDPSIYFSSHPVAFVSQGSTSAMVAFLANAVEETKTVNIVASYGNSSASAPVTVIPSDGAERWVTSVTMNPGTVAAGSSSTGTLTLNEPAPVGGVIVQLFSDSSAAAVPASVTVPQGALSANFLVSTATVTSNVTAKIYALLNFSVGGVLNITAAAAPSPTPAAPTLVSPVNDATVSQPVTFDWNNVANAASYEIQVDDSSTFSAPLVRNMTSTVSQTTVTGLQAVRHWWRVRARNSAGVAGPFSTIRRFTPRATTTTPSAPSLSSLALNPTSVTGGNNSQGTVTLTGAAPSSGAVVTLGSGNASVVSVPSSVTVASGATSASFAITTRAVTASTPVTLFASYSNLTRSATLNVNPPLAGPLAAPSLVSPANDARFSPGANITFDWSDVSGAASYTIQIDDHDSFPSPWLVNQTVTSSTFSTSTLPTRTMWFRVRANDASGNPGNWSSIRRFEVKD